MLRGINRIFHEALTSGSREELEQVCLDVAKTLTGASQGFLFVPDRSERQNGEHDAARPFATGNFKALCERVLRQGETVIANDMAQHLHEAGDSTQSEAPPNAFMGVPLKQDEQTIGMIGLADREGGFREWEVEMMESLAPSILHALKGRRADRTSGQEDARLSAALDRKRHLATELQHRMRNMLAVTRSVFTRTAARGGSVEEMLDHFRGRLDALARTQLLLLQGPQGEVQLEDLIRDELLSIGITASDALLIEGPEVFLDSHTAELLGLAFHELTTNAVKFGAMKVPDAWLRVTWSLEEKASAAPRLRILWEEHGVPAVAVHPQRGFGTEFIEEALPYRIGAQTQLDILGGGVRCRISLALQQESRFTAPE